MIFNLSNIKTVLVFAGFIAAFSFYKDYKFQKSENKRQTENSSQIRKFDSLKYAYQTYSKDELKEFLEYSRKDLQQFLNKNKVSTNRIEKVITQKLSFSDNSVKSLDLQPIIDAVNYKKDLKLPIIDSTSCMVIKGFVSLKNDSLDLKITDRIFKNKTDVVSYWERNQWRFLGVKTRLFGKKKTTVLVKDECGNTETLVIDSNKK